MGDLSVGRCGMCNGCVGHCQCHLPRCHTPEPKPEPEPKSEPAPSFSDLVQAGKNLYETKIRLEELDREMEAVQREKKVIDDVIALQERLSSLPKLDLREDNLESIPAPVMSQTPPPSPAPPQQHIELDEPPVLTRIHTPLPKKTKKLKKKGPSEAFLRLTKGQKAKPNAGKDR